MFQMEAMGRLVILLEYFSQGRCICEVLYSLIFLIFSLRLFSDLTAFSEWAFSVPRVCVFSLSPSAVFIHDCLLWRQFLDLMPCLSVGLGLWSELTVV